MIRRMPICCWICWSSNATRLRHLQPDNEETRRVQNLVEERRKVVDEQTAHVNRLIGYFRHRGLQCRNNCEATPGQALNFENRNRIGPIMGQTQLDGFCK